MSDARNTPWLSWLLPLIFAVPWIAAIAYFWRHRVRDGAAAPSTAEQAGRRLWT